VEIIQDSYYVILFVGLLNYDGLDGLGKWNAGEINGNCCPGTAK
jgi:hypothetical protein